MQALGVKPNLVFLIGVRNNDLYIKLLITRLRLPIYRKKILKARTRISVCHYDQYTDHLCDGKTTIVYSIKNDRGLEHQKFHREDGPATIYNNEDDQAGPKRWTWIENGELHRNNAPAIIEFRYFYGYVDKFADIRYNIYSEDSVVSDSDFIGTGLTLSSARDFIDASVTIPLYLNYEWYQNGEYHRDNGPAIYNRYLMCWYQNGLLHRDDGYAIIHYDHELLGTELSMYKNGMLHCETGPCVLFIDGLPDYKYLELNCKELESKLLFEEWKINDVQHREDGPAVRRRVHINAPWDETWVQKGARHNSNGPAVLEYKDNVLNVEEWWINGKKHRLDGPAYINKANGVTTWFLDGNRHRIDGPAHVNTKKDIESWYINGKLHRTDGPASRKGKNTWWYKNGLLHRTDGPARVIGNKKTYFIEGEQVEPF